MPSPLLTLSSDERTSTRAYLRIAGWALLLLGLLDAVYILIGTDWMNAVSELRTSGRLSEHALAVLLGMLLLLVPAGDTFTPAQARRQALLGRLSMVFAALYLVLAPFIVLSATRIHRALSQQLTAWVEQQQTLTGNAIEKLNEQPSREDIQRFVQPLPFDDNMFYEPDLQVLKANIVERFNELSEGNLQRSEANLHTRLRSVWRDAVKWTLGALVTAGAFGLMGWRARRYGRLARASRGKR